jgi:sugar phosphate permease
VARFQVLGAFSVLAALTYLDRICMAQAAGPIREELGLNARQMSLIFGAFTLGYSIFEVPTGRLGDAIGPRRVLVRVVLWWSLFTALTGWVSGLVPLLLVRFAFGAGEAGAFPNIARALTGWFPPAQRGRVQGTIWTTARLGGAVAPPLTAALISAIGWRQAFFAFGALGLVWVLPFWLWYRDDPDEHPSVTPGERDWIRSWSPPGARGAAGHAPAPWRRILTNPSVLGLAGATFWSAFGWYFFVTWLPTYLESGRGLTMSSASWLAALPLSFGVFGCWIGGWVSDRLIDFFGGLRWARRVVGFTGMMMASVWFLLGVRAANPVGAVVCMALASFFNDLSLSSLWAANMDIGERHAGSVSGLVNTASGAGALLSPFLFGSLLDAGWGWTPSLVCAGAGFMLSGLCWLLVDPTRTVSGGEEGG